MENKVFWKEAPLVRLAVCLMAGIIVGDIFVVGRWLLGDGGCSLAVEEV